MTPEERAAIADARNEEDALKLRGLGLAEKSGPDEAAEALTLARKNGVPRVSVETDLQGYRSLDEMERVDSRTRDTPALRSWLAGHDDNYAVARDDVDSLSGVEKAMRTMGAFAKGAPRAALQGVLDMRTQAYGEPLRYVEPVGDYATRLQDWEARKDDRKVLTRNADGTLNLNLGNLIRGTAGAIGVYDNVKGGSYDRKPERPMAAALLGGQNLKNEAEYIKAWSEVLKPWQEQLAKGAADSAKAADELNPQTGDFVADSALSGVRSLSNMMLALVVAAKAGPSAGAAVMGGQVQGQEYASGRFQMGLDVQTAAERSDAQAAIELVTERISLGVLDDIIASNKPIVQKFIAGMTAEQIQEQAATFGQDFIDWQIVNPEKSTKDFLLERPERAVQTAIATFVAAGGMQGALMGLDYALTSADEKARRSLMSEGDKAIEDAIKAAGKSKLAQRSPEKMEEAVRAIGEANGIDNVAVDLDGVVEALNQKGVDPGIVLEALGIDRERLATDYERFGESEIEFAKLMSSPAVREHMDDIRPHLRTPGEEYTPARKEQMRADLPNTIKEEVARVQQMFEGTAERTDREAQAAEMVRERILGAGIWGENKVTDANATLAAAMNNTFAKLAGMDPVDFYEAHFPRIQMSVDGMVQEADGETKKARSTRHKAERDALDAEFDDIKELARLEDQVNATHAKMGKGEASEEAQRLLPEQEARLRELEARKAEWEQKHLDLLKRQKAEREGSMQEGVLGQTFGAVPEGSPEYQAAIAKGLDMSQPARMQRARDMGFDTDTVLYHGTGKDFDAFDLSKSGANQPGRLKREVGIFLTDTPEDASFYANYAAENATKESQLGQVMPVYARMKNPKVVDFSDFDEPIEYNSVLVSDLINEAKKEGRDGLVIRGMMETFEDHAGPRNSFADQVVIFDPSNIRSVNAAFDPDMADSPNLLAQGDETHRGQFSTTQNIVTLFEGRNYSTLMHEMSHWFLFQMEQFANEENAPPAIQKMWSEVNKWYDGLNRSLEGKERWVDMQETFAETFEVYLETGQAPSVGLRDAFRAFKSWLATLWKTVRGRGSELARANLDPEITAIFDRMLATEEEINAATQQSYTEAETVAKGLLEKGILTQKEYDKAIKNLDDAREAVKEEMMKRLMADMRREDEAWWKTERERVKGEKTREFDRSNAGRAWNWLGLGAWKGDVPVEESPGADVEALYQTQADQTETPEFKAWFGKSHVVDANGKPKRVFHGPGKGAAGFTVFNTDGRGKTDGTGAFFSDQNMGAFSYSGTQAILSRLDPADVKKSPDDFFHIEEEDGYFAGYDENGFPVAEGDTKQEVIDEMLRLYPYGMEPTGNYEVYLSIQDPMIVDARGQNWDNIVEEFVVENDLGDPVHYFDTREEAEALVAEYPDDYTIQESWGQSTDDIVREARMAGHDGVIFHNITDEGPHGSGYGWGDTVYVAFNPSQIKSVENTGTFDPNNPDILYQTAARTLDEIRLEAEQNNAELDHEIKTVRDMLNEAAACAAGIAPAGVGQMVAGTALGISGGAMLAIPLAMNSPSAQAERERRMKEWHLQEHKRLMREDPEYRAKHDQFQARKQARYDEAIAEYRAAKEFEQKLEAYADIDNMPTDSQFDMNSWTEQVSGVSGEFLDDLIGHEADGDWQAEAGTSTAKGGGQFIDSTWLRMMRQHGPELGLNPGMSRDEILALRTDRRWGTMMTAYYAMENRATLERKLDRPVSQKDAYLAHFLGATAAAKALTMDPNANAAEAFPDAAAANQNVFYKYGNLEKPRTVAEVIQRQTKGFSAEPLMVWDYPVEMGAEPNDGRVDR